MRGMRLLVPGGAGFIGSAVCRFLVGEIGAEVLNLDKLTYAAYLDSLRPVESHPRYRFHRCDIGDRAALAELLRGFEPDAVLHLAAESHVDRSIDGPGEFIKTNIEGTYVLLEAALDYWRGLPADRVAGFRFHPVSTDEVFGSLGPDGKFTEASRYPPNPPYRPHGDLITFVTDRPGHDRRYAMDWTKLENELGWRPRESFETGLRKTVAWYLDNRGWWEPIWSAKYRGDRLGTGARAEAPSAAGA